MLHSAIDAQALVDLKILIIIAFCLLASPFLAKFLRLPLSATEIILGALFGFLGLIGESVNFKLLANAGFYYLMFIAGMEVNLHKLLNFENKFLKYTFLYVLLLYVLSVFFVSVFNLSYIFILIVPIMSVGILSTLFKDFGKDCAWLRISMFVATWAEVVSIILLTILGAFVSEQNSLEQVLRNVLYLGLFLAFCFVGFKILGVIFWWYPQLRVILMPWEDKNERDVRFCMSIFMLTIAVMIIAHLEIALGAFIAGAFIGTFLNHKKDMEQKLSSFGYELLIPIFFVYIGSTLDVRLLLQGEILLKTLEITALMLSVRLLSSLIFYKKLGAINTLLFALSHSMPLTLLIATATLSFKANLIDKSLYSALILTALFEVLIVMLFIRLLANLNARKSQI